MKAKLLFLLSISLTFSVDAFAQGAKANGTSPSASTDIGKSSNWDSLMNQSKPGDYLGGTVAVANGALPWDPISVTVTCDGKIRYTSTTDPKGRFVIAPAKTDSSLIGNSDTKTKLAGQFVGCGVQAVLPGFDSSSINIANRNVEDNPNIGTITLKREDASAGAAVSNTSASAPKDAMKSFEKARSEWLDGKPDRARKDLEKAVQIYPQFAEAWYQLGKIQQASKKEDAGNSFSKAIAADPKFILPYEQMAPITAQAGKWQELVDLTSHELELNPRGNPETWYYNALGNLKLNKVDVAQANAEKALAMDPLHTEPNTEQLLAVMLANKSDYAGALQHLRSCIAYLPAGPNADLVKKQIAQLETMVPQAK